MDARDAIPLLVFSVTCFVMILGILFRPSVRLGRFRAGSYWLATSAGAAALLLIPGVADFARLSAFISDFSLPVNPVKILSLFLTDYSEEELDAVRALARDAQFYWDFVFVENSEGAHNPSLTTECLDKAETLTNEALGMLTT